MEGGTLSFSRTPFVYFTVWMNFIFCANAADRIHYTKVLLPFIIYEHTIVCV